MKIIAIAASFMLATTSVYAADAVIYSAPASVEIAPSYNWAGVYIYGLGGYENASSHNAHLNVNRFGGPGGTYGHKGNDGIFGAAAGYNWQLGNGVILGAEVGIRSGTKLDDGNAYIQYNNFTNSSLEYLGTLKARLGYDAGAWMPYVTGGVAYGRLTSSQLIATLPPQTWEAKKSATGFVIGAGADFKVTEQLFVGLEYNYTDLGTVDFSALDNSGGNATISGHYKSHAVFAKVGVRF